MGTYLDLDDAAGPHPVAVRELAELRAEIKRLRVGHERYETVRRMNVPQFRDAFILSTRTGKPFDEIVDNLRPFLRPND